MKNYINMFLVSVFIFACRKEEIRDHLIDSRSITLEVLDSIEIPFRHKFVVHDLDPIQKTVLFTTPGQQPKIILADFEGEIFATLPTKEVFSGCFGSLLAPLKIDGDDSILAYGSNAFLTFDFSGKIQSCVKHASGKLLESPKLAIEEGIEKIGNKHLYINQGLANIDQKDKNIRRELRLLVWLYPENGESEPFVQFPETSIFREEKSFFKEAWKPVFTVVEDHIFLIFGTEPIIYVYKAFSPYSMVSSIPIDLPNFSYSQLVNNHSSRLNYFEMPFNSGKILSLKRLDSHFIIAYFPGVNSLYSKKQLGISTQELNSLSRKMAKNHPNRIAIVDLEGNVINDFVPGRLDPKSMLLRNNELWMLEKLDVNVEKDYFRLFRVGLKIEEK